MDVQPPAVAVEGVTKRFDGKVVLEPTSLELPEGSRLALLGPSGSGKSTLLRLIVGLLAPDAGRIAVAGTQVTPETVGAIRRRLGYVIQDGGLFPHLTAADNASLMARHLGWDRPRIRARLRELCDLVGLEAEHLDRYPLELSGGQRQRVGLMRALMLDPDLLLFDEPMAALDPVVRTRLQEDLRRIFAELGKTVLIVTHDLAEAAFLASHVALMNKGRIVQRGPLKDLIDRPADPFVGAFLNAQRAPWWSEWPATG